MTSGSKTASPSMGSLKSGSGFGLLHPSAATLHFDRFGRYELTFPELADYQPLAKVTVDVTATALDPVRIDVRPVPVGAP